jgi:hypothetical protein|nr:MAG TPA: hypothetical protein [Caudoviricetes sp.]
MDKKGRIKLIEKTIKELNKKGLDVDKATEGKDINKLAHSIKTFENFMKRVARVKERPKILQESKAIDEKIKKRVENNKKQKNMSVKRNYISKETKNIVKYNENFKPTKRNIKLKTQMVANEFLLTYFKEIKLDNLARKKINKLTNRFGNRLDLIYDFMDKVYDLSFKYPMEKEIFKSEHADEYHQMMYDRLDYFERILESDYGI